MNIQALEEAEQVARSARAFKALEIADEALDCHVLGDCEGGPERRWCTWGWIRRRT